MITVQVTKPTAERFQSDHSGLRLSLVNARYQRPAASFDGGLVS
ncbi:MAG: hypothetical protein ACRYFS_09735 [Janthinobacterium lividum]